MGYIQDENLNFLKYCDNNDLDILVKYLTEDKNGTSRLTETLTISDGYKKYYPNHKKYWTDIAAELQTFGGNTFMNILRLGDGVKYKEILIDVCKKMKVNFNENSSVITIENNLMCKVLEDSIKNLSEEEIKELMKDLKINTTNFTKQGVTLAIQALIKQGGFMSYQILVIVANAVAKQILGHGLKFATNSALTKTMSILIGPIGWAITSIWTIIDIAGPAYRVTIPACIQIAYMRSKYIYCSDNTKKCINTKDTTQQDKLEVERAFMKLYDMGRKIT